MTDLSLRRPPYAPALAEKAEADGVLATIILPAYNEARALPRVLAELQHILDQHYEVIVVDDGSTDDIAAAVGVYPCRLIRHKANRGKGAAVQTGIANAHGRYLIVMDADGTYPSAAIPRIVALLADHDLVRCNRRSTGAHMPFINRVGNWVFDRLLAVVHGLDGTDHLSGLYGLRREAVLPMKLESVGFDIEAEIGIKARVKGLRVATFPIDYQPRLGDKKLHPWRDGLMILGRILTLVLLYNPMLTFIVPGVLLMIVAISGALILERGPVITPYFGLSIHSFIVATLGVLAAFQLAVFGMAAALYGVEAGYRPPAWLVWVSSRPIRLGAALVGFLMASVSALNILWLIGQWIGGGAGIFEGTRAVVLTSTVLVWGLQILSAALFLSIFAGRLQKHDPTDADETPDAG
jgi:hypothetical protein